MRELFCDLCATYQNDSARFHNQTILKGDGVEAASLGTDKDNQKDQDQAFHRFESRKDLSAARLECRFFIYAVNVAERRADFAECTVGSHSFNCSRHGIRTLLRRLLQFIKRVSDCSFISARARMLVTFDLMVANSFINHERWKIGRASCRERVEMSG